MERKQKGITLMSFIIVLAVVGFFGLITMKLFPMYSEFNNLKSAVNEFAKQPNSASLTLAQVQADLGRRFNIAYVESVDLKTDVKIVRGAGRTSQIEVAYEVRRPMFGNLDVVGVFSHTAELNGASSSE